MVEKVADIQFAGVLFIHGEHDFGQCKRTHANFKQVVVRADNALFREFPANQFEFTHQRIVVEIAFIIIVRGQCGHDVIELAIEILAREQ